MIFGRKSPLGRKKKIVSQFDGINPSEVVEQSLNHIALECSGLDQHPATMPRCVGSDRILFYDVAGRLGTQCVANMFALFPRLSTSDRFQVVRM